MKTRFWQLVVVVTVLVPLGEQGFAYNQEQYDIAKVLIERARKRIKKSPLDPFSFKNYFQALAKLSDIKRAGRPASLKKAAAEDSEKLKGEVVGHAANLIKNSGANDYEVSVFMSDLRMALGENDQYKKLQAMANKSDDQKKSDRFRAHVRNARSNLKKQFLEDARREIEQALKIKPQDEEAKGLKRKIAAEYDAYVTRKGAAMKNWEEKRDARKAEDRKMFAKMAKKMRTSFQSICGTSAFYDDKLGKVIYGHQTGSQKIVWEGSNANHKSVKLMCNGNIVFYKGKDIDYYHQGMSQQEYRLRKPGG